MYKLCSLIVSVSIWPSFFELKRRKGMSKMITNLVPKTVEKEKERKKLFG